MTSDKRSGSSRSIVGYLLLLVLPLQLSAQPSPAGTSASTDPCRFPAEVPEHAVVMAAGGHAARLLPYAIDDQSNQAATEFEVLVHQPGASVVLMLGAHDPTVWRVKWTEGTRIVGLLLGGYFNQLVFGLPAGIPTERRIFKEGGDCPYFYVSDSELPKLNPISRRAFGRPITRVFFAENGRIDIGKAPAGSRFLTQETTASPASNVPRTAAGRAGIGAALASGFIRQATWSEVEAWQQQLTAGRPLTSRPLARATSSPPRIGLPDAFVVQRPFSFPPGLYGLDAVAFYVPKGIPVPTGNPGHARVYDLNTLKCVGPC